jgi:hypothetical protein
VLFRQRLLPLNVAVGSIQRIGYAFFVRSACSLYEGKPPSPFPHKGRSGSFLSYHYVPHPSFRSEEEWVTPHYPRWACIDVPRELQAGKSKRMPEPHSIGFGWWPYGRISKYLRAVMVDVRTVR